VLAAEDAPGELGAKFGIVSFQLIGVKNISAANALAKPWRGPVHQGKRQEGDGQGED
jgi:hypothetical protein